MNYNKLFKDNVIRFIFFIWKLCRVQNIYLKIHCLYPLIIATSSTYPLLFPYYFSYSFLAIPRSHLLSDDSTTHGPDRGSHGIVDIPRHVVLGRLQQGKRSITRTLSFQRLHQVQVKELGLFPVQGQKFCYTPSNGCNKYTSFFKSQFCDCQHQGVRWMAVSGIGNETEYAWKTSSWFDVGEPGAVGLSTARPYISNRLRSTSPATPGGTRSAPPLPGFHREPLPPSSWFLRRSYML